MKEELTWKEAVKRIMLRYSALAIRRINACLRGEPEEHFAQTAARECGHYGLLFRDGYIEKPYGRRYDPRKIVYLKRGNE